MCEPTTFFDALIIEDSVIVEYVPRTDLAGEVMGIMRQGLGDQEMAATA